MSTRSPGVSLVELIIALAVFTLVMAATLGFYRQQALAFSEGNERMELMQNLRYGINTVQQQLRTAGIGVPPKQPVVVYANTDAVAFNADYASNLQNDFFAVYYDRQLPDEAARAATPDHRFAIPNSTFAYPDSLYYTGAGVSTAETIAFFFRPDSTTARPDDYILFRQVNHLAPDVVARHLLRSSRPFFTYYVRHYASSGSPVTEVPTSHLPLAHTVAIHGAPDDTGRVAGVDSIRAVRLSYAATGGRTGDEEVRREISRLIRMPNAGLAGEQVCGDRPILGTTLLATPVGPTSTVAGHIHLQWGQSTDETGGERDVLRYVIWRRKHEPGSAWADPLVSIPPGSTVYEYDDFTAVKDQEYDYALAAQDCTPRYSSLSVSADRKWE